MGSRQSLDTAAPADSSTTIEPPFRKSIRGLVGWLAPDMGLIFAIATLLMLFFKFGGSTGLFDDSNTGWHIRDGERIVSSGALPHADPFSFSKPNAPWVAWEWGADGLMAVVHHTSGLAGIALLYGLAIGAAVWMWFRLNRAASGNSLVACLLFLILLPVTSIHWLARPHLLGWLFLLATVWLCESMPQRVRWVHMALVATVAAAWANIHASFFFGPLILLTYALGAYLEPLIWEPGATERHASQVTPARHSEATGYTVLSLTALAGTLANPYGWRLHQHVLGYLSDSGLMNNISEFRSFDFHAKGALPVVLMLVVSFAGGFAALMQRRPARFLLSMLLTVAALRSARAMPAAALVLLPLASGSITAVLRRASGLTPWLRCELDGALNYGDGLDMIDRHLGGLAIVPFIALLVFVQIRTTSGFPSDRLPVAASAKVASLPSNSRILSPDDFGGYLIYRFSGERKVFVDGRSDFYGAEFMERYARLMEAQPGWTEEFNRWGFTHALLRADGPLVPALNASGWHEIYRDKTAVLLTGEPKL